MTDRVDEIEARVSAEPCDGQMVVTFVGENDYREKSCNKCGKDSHYVSPLTGDEAKFLLSTIRALQAELGELRGRLDATKSTNNSPGRLTGFRQVEHPCEDCIDDWCQMNCGPATPSLEKDND